MLRSIFRCVAFAAVFASAVGLVFPALAQNLDTQIERLYAEGKFAAAIPLAERALAQRERELGPDHPDVAISLFNLASLYDAQGRYADAEPLLKRSLAIREKMLGADDPGLVVSLNSLASAQKAQGRYAEAEPLLKRGLAICEKALGPDDPNVADSLNNLALLLVAQARYAEAEPLFTRSLGIWEKARGVDGVEVAVSLNNLAGLYETQGRYADAEPLYKRSLAIGEKAFPAGHPTRATSLGNLAGLYQEQGRDAEAEPLYRRILADWETSLGPDHPDVAVSLNSLALLYVGQGRYAEAEPLLKRSLVIHEKALGPDHPDVAMSLGNLALLSREQGRYAEAEPLFRRSLAIREKALGPDHPDVAVSLNSLAKLSRAQGRDAEAEQLLKRSLAIREKALGADHPDVAVSLNNLAELYHAQGRYTEAEPSLQRSLAIREKALGPDHPDVAVSLNNLAKLYRAMGRQADAEAAFTRAAAVPNPNTRQLRVVFGTNRLRHDIKDVIGFSGERGEVLAVGEAVVLVPNTEVIRRAERRALGSGLLDKAGGELTSAGKLIVRAIAPAAEPGALAGTAKPLLARASLFKSQVLVFVHGYNVGFEEALSGAAKIAYDLEFDGAVMAFSWPSAKALLGYGYDRDSADIAANYLVEMLDEVATTMPKTKLHFVAHSMGNMVLLAALEKIALRKGAGPKLDIGEIIAAHPDVDGDRFRQLAKAVKPLGAKITLYASSDDRALWISKLLRGLTGRAGTESISAEGVDTIDITGLGSLWDLNHSIYAHNPIVFGDMTRLIASSKRPVDVRTPDFEAVTGERGTHWRYRPAEPPAATASVGEGQAEGAQSAPAP